jgi:hypothetical protein
VLVAQPTHRVQVARRLKEHSGGTLYKRLRNHCANLVSVLGQQLVKMGGIASARSVGLEQQGLVERVKQVNTAH